MAKMRKYNPETDGGDTELTQEEIKAVLTASMVKGKKPDTKTTPTDSKTLNPKTDLGNIPINTSPTIQSNITPPLAQKYGDIPVTPDYDIPDYTQPIADQSTPPSIAGQVQAPPSSTPLVDSLTKKQAAGGEQTSIEPQWKPPRKGGLNWLAALGTGLSGVGATLNPKGNVQQEMAPGMAVLSGLKDNQQKQYMYAVANDPASPLSVLARNSLEIKDKNVSWVMLKELYPELMDQMARDFNANQGSGKETRMDMEALRRKQEQTKRLQQLNVPGYTLEFDLNNPSLVLPTEDEAKKGRKAVENINTFKDGVATYNKLIDKFGAYERFGAGGEQMLALSTELKTMVQQLKELGAIQTADLTIIEGLIPNPRDYEMKVTTKTAIKARLKEALDRMNVKTDEGFISKGYKKNVAGDKPQTADNVDKQNTLRVGDVKDGYKYKGGDTKDSKNWEKVK